MSSTHLDTRVLLGLVVLLMSCAGSRPPAPAPDAVPASTESSAAPTSSPRDTVATAPSREYRGAYTSGFEKSWFEPCNASDNDRMWWVTLTGDAVHQRDSLLAKLAKSGLPKTDGLLVRWRGTISRRMPAGHMGRGTRYMLVTEVLDIRPLPGTGGCTTI